MVLRDPSTLGVGLSRVSSVQHDEGVPEMRKSSMMKTPSTFPTSIDSVRSILHG